MGSVEQRYVDLSFRVLRFSEKHCEGWRLALFPLLLIFYILLIFCVSRVIKKLIINVPYQNPYKSRLNGVYLLSGREIYHADYRLAVEV